MCMAYQMHFNIILLQHLSRTALIVQSVPAFFIKMYHILNIVVIFLELFTAYHYEIMTLKTTLKLFSHLKKKNQTEKYLQGNHINDHTEIFSFIIQGH